MSSEGSFCPDENPDAGGVFRDLLFEEDSTNQRDGKIDVSLPVKTQRKKLLKPIPHITKLVLTACIGSFLFGFSVSVMNTCLGHVSWDMDWCPHQNDLRSCHRGTYYETAITSVIFFGAMIASLAAAAIQSHGRRQAIIISFAGFVLGSITTTCADAFPSLIWGRFLIGLSVGLASVAVPTFLSEITPPNVRGFYGIFHQILIVTGIFIGVLFGLPLAFLDPLPPLDTPHGRPRYFSRAWWRVMVALPVLPAVMGTIIMHFSFPYETPHYYLEKNDRKSAQRVLCRIVQKDDVKEELDGIAAEVILQRRAVALRGDKSLISEMFRPPEHRHAVVLACLLSALQQLGGINYFTSSSTELFISTGLSSRGAIIATQVVFLVNVLVSLPAAITIERAGRRRLLVWGTIGQAVSLLPATVSLWVDTESKFTLWSSVVGCLMFMVAFGLTFGPVLWVYLFEMFPHNIKNGASSLAVACNWLAAIIIVTAAKLIHTKYKYTIFTITSLIAFALCVGWVRETKGRSLGDSPYVSKNI